MVSDTTYIYTEEGWLYLAAIMDLYGRKIVGMAVSEKNDQNLVIAVLEDAKNRIGKKHLEVAFFIQTVGRPTLQTHTSKKSMDTK